MIKALQLHKCRSSQISVIVIDNEEGIDGPDAQALFVKEGDELFDLLLNNLPGGVYDRLCDRLQMYWRACSLQDDAIWECQDMDCGWRGHRPVYNDNNCPVCLGNASKRVNHDKPAMRVFRTE
jgi:hypothetical protein